MPRGPESGVGRQRQSDSVGGCRGRYRQRQDRTPSGSFSSESLSRHIAARDFNRHYERPPSSLTYSATASAQRGHDCFLSASECSACFSLSIGHFCRTLIQFSWYEFGALARITDDSCVRMRTLSHRSTLQMHQPSEPLQPAQSDRHEHPEPWWQPSSPRMTVNRSCSIAP